MSAPLPSKYTVEFQTFHKLTLRERFKLLFGYNIIANVVAVVHVRRGSIRSKVDLLLTNEMSAAGQQRSNVSES